MIEIVLFGPPRGKARPRFRIIKARSGATFGSAYTDAQTRSYEANLTAAGVEAMAGRTPLEGPLAVVVQALMPIPASWPRKRREAALRQEIRPTGKPDTDNLAKCAGDALNGIVYRDDSQIVTLSISKFYSDNPCLRVAVQVLDENVTEPSQSIQNSSQVLGEMEQ